MLGRCHDLVRGLPLFKWREEQWYSSMSAGPLPPRESRAGPSLLHQNRSSACHWIIGLPRSAAAAVNDSLKPEAEAKSIGELGPSASRAQPWPLSARRLRSATCFRRTVASANSFRIFADPVRTPPSRRRATTSISASWRSLSFPAQRPHSATAGRPLRSQNRLWACRMTSSKTCCPT